MSLLFNTLSFVIVFLRLPPSNMFLLFPVSSVSTSTTLFESSSLRPHLPDWSLSSMWQGDTFPKCTPDLVSLCWKLFQVLIACRLKPCSVGLCPAVLTFPGSSCGPQPSMPSFLSTPPTPASVFAWAVALSARTCLSAAPILPSWHPLLATFHPASALSLNITFLKLSYLPFRI